MQKAVKHQNITETGMLSRNELNAFFEKNTIPIAKTTEKRKHIIIVKTRKESSLYNNKQITPRN